MTDTASNKKPTTFRVNFTPQEMRILEKRAKSVDMELKPFIKQCALRKRVSGYRLQPLTQHITQIDQIIQAARQLASESHTDRWLYEKDLELIAERLEEVIAIEQTIQALLRRRIS